MKETVAIIPARMDSSRFPGKPLAMIQRIPMIGHVYFRTRMCPLLSETYVATCDQEIQDYVQSIGGKVVMTKNTHERASDRTAEAVFKIESEIGQKVESLVMVQGDEPMVRPEMIEQSVTPILKNTSIQVVNLMACIKTVKEFEDPNEVKVVVDKNGFALYFSREPIPSRMKYNKTVPMYKQVCIISFTRQGLLDFTELEPTPLEIIESVDMNRFLEHGIKIKMIKTAYETFSVDTESDLLHVQELMKSDKLIRSYSYKKIK